MTVAPMSLQDAVRCSSLPWPEGLSPPVASQIVTGGWVGETWYAALADGATVVVKRCVSAADVEVDGLAALGASGVPVPAVLGAAGDVLVLERVGEGVAPPTAPDWEHLGRSVAGMHQRTYERFGWHRDNHAGRFAQRNPLDRGLADLLR